MKHRFRPYSHYLDVVILGALLGCVFCVYKLHVRYTNDVSVFESATQEFLQLQSFHYSVLDDRLSELWLFLKEEQLLFSYQLFTDRVEIFCDGELDQFKSIYRFLNDRSFIFREFRVRRLSKGALQLKIVVERMGYV